jgi:hypothetical protein
VSRCRHTQIHHPGHRRHRPATGRGHPTGAILAVTPFGLGFGVSSLATPSLLADRYGTTAYASIAGTLATPVTLAKAGAPFGAAALYTLTGSYPPVLIAIGIACLIAAGGILARATTTLPTTTDADATGTTGHTATPCRRPPQPRPDRRRARGSAPRPRRHHVDQIRSAWVPRVRKKLEAGQDLVDMAAFGLDQVDRGLRGVVVTGAGRVL